MGKISGQTSDGLKQQKHRSCFINGAISPQQVVDVISNHSSKKNIGAHSIFLGQVRNDSINGNEVQAIDYSTFEEMAEEAIRKIREDAFEKYSLLCLHIYHSKGRVNAGEISLFVFTSSIHRKDAITACEEIVERIKKEVPVWGKELFTDEKYEWKINK